MSLELLDGPVVEGFLNVMEGRVGQDEVTPILELLGPLQGPYLDLTADALGALAPLQLDGIQVVFLRDVLCGSQPGILHVHLDQDLAVAFMKLFVDLDPAVHLRRLDDFAVIVSHQSGVHATDVLPAYQGNPRDGSTNGEVLPVDPGYICGSQRAGEDGNPHLNLLVPSILGLGIYLMKYGSVRVRFDPLGQSFGSCGIALDVQV